MTAISATSSKHTTRLQSSPLAPAESAYRQRLATCGYAQGTQHQYVSCITHFAYWMGVNTISMDRVSSVIIDRFIGEHLPRCTCPGRVQRHPPQVRAALRQLLTVLLDFGAVPDKSSTDVVEAELDRFETYQRDLRGLAMNTLLQRRRIVGDMLRHKHDEDRQLLPFDIMILRDFMAERLKRWSPASAAVVASALRAYFRYRALQGDDVIKLLSAINSPACWKLASLPETISSEQIDRVLNSFHAPLPSWRRGAAVAQCVARLGLRSSEVVGLELDDLDWQSGTLRLRHCKSRRADFLPMPMAVGAAIAEYLRDERPTCFSRRVFVRHVAPVEVPLLPSLAGRIIRDAYERCGLPFTRVHIFRHSLAARILGDGGTLKEVADVLRHRSLDTAQIYAKLDERRLSAVTMPWPGSTP